MTNKLVSIVLPTYNGKKYIKETIESVINQTYKNWELIIVNDCSTDDTLEIVNNYARENDKIKVISHEVNQKIAGALNSGFKEAKGEYFTWISDDNIFKPNAVEYMVNLLNQNKNVDFVSCSYETIDANGNFIELSYEYFSKRRTIEELIYKNNIGACFMYRKTIAEKIGSYDINFPLANDYDYWMRMAANGNIIYDNTILYQYRSHPNNLTSLKREDMIKETINIIEKNIYTLILKLKMSKWRKANLLVDLYDDFKRENKYGEIYLNTARKIAPIHTKLADFNNKIMKYIFCVKRYSKHTFIYIFGIKIKLKRKKK